MGPATEAVVLLHGLGRTRRVMAPLARALAAEGYHVTNETYPSRYRPIADLARGVAELIAERCPPERIERVHLVGFSLGGIIARCILARDPPPHAGRLVQIGSPNGGSAKAGLAARFRLFHWFFGPAMGELAAHSGAHANAWGRPAVEFGIIAGGTRGERGFSPLLEGDNDGTVRVAETWLDGALDHILLPHRHIFLASRPATLKNVLHFLRHGRFAEDAQRVALALGPSSNDGDEETPS